MGQLSVIPVACCFMAVAQFMAHGWWNTT